MKSNLPTIFTIYLIFSLNQPKPKDTSERKMVVHGDLHFFIVIFCCYNKVTGLFDSSFDVSGSELYSL